jgi:chemotaxis protein CheX
MSEPQTQTRPSLDVRLVNPIVSATTEVLQTMAQMEAKLVATRAEKDYQASGDISAVIGILGEEGEGMVALSFPLSLATIIVSRLLGVTPAHLSSDDRSDGVGELVNMISGNAKAVLSRESGSTYKLSLPTIILGAKHEVSSRPRNNPYLLLEFEAEDETFHLQLTYKRV